MASTSNTSTQPEIEESAPSTSASAGFQFYKPPTTKLPFISEKKYHVFLSFRGEDIRETFVDHLYQALSEADLEVFLDTEKLKRGEMLSETFKKAIEGSAIRIPIFSEGYADSVWCLKEATAMLRTPGLIIPLFYHVDPTHVRFPENGESPYKQSFLKHYRHSDRYPREAIEWWKRALQQISPCLETYGYSVRHSGEEIDVWKNALKEICERSGWTMDITEGYEARLVKTVVNDVIKTFDRVPLDVIKHAVGMESVKNSLIEKLGINLVKDVVSHSTLNLVKDVVKVGILGIAGVGKTTAAKAVYNEIYADFEAACFVFNVRDIGAEITGLIQLQKKILKELSKYGGEVYSVDEGISLFKYHLKGKRVLIVLDDVDKKEKLNALIGDWLAPDSRVIIASRDKQILNDAMVSSERIHELCGLNVDEGLQLFKWHAFFGASPSASYQDLSRRIVEACNGHPLSLEVIGSYLYGKDDISYWNDALNNIILHEGILDRLEISYTALSDEEKEIFVDIACYFIGEHKALPVAFWKSMKYKKVDTYLLNLSMKLLIKIDEEGLFDMHDLLRDMGRNIADRKHNRQWETADSSFTSDSANFSHLRLNGVSPQKLEILCRPGLRYLHLENLRIEGMTGNTLAMLPPSLIWLRLENCTFAFGEERAHHCIGGKSPQLMKTMQIKFSSGVDSVSVSLSSLFSLPNIQLQHLDFEGCEDLKSLPDAIGNLSQLQQLHLKKCRRLSSLPDSIGNLSKLQHLMLRRCSSLKNLPRTIGKLSQLQHLDMKRCDSLNNLPDLIGDLSELQYLNLRRCRVLNSLPNTIWKLSQLRHLDLKMCCSLNNLPDSIGSLSQLQHLNLEKCVILKSLPSTIGNLLQLQYLNLKECVNLESLPDTIGKLSQLQHLDLEKCVNLKNLPYTFDNLSQLQYLKRPPYV